MTDSGNSNHARTALRIALLAVAGCLFVVSMVYLKRSGLMQQAILWIDQLGPWKPVVFIALYIATVLLCIPASLMTMAGGALFGLFVGDLLVLSSAYVAAMLCFVISRHFASPWFHRKIAGHPKFVALDDAVAREGWKIAILMRVAPMFPFSFTNYGFGVTRLPTWQYAVTTLAIVPTTTMYVYFGTVIGDVAGIRQAAPMPYWLKWTIGAITICAVLYITRWARRALKQRM